MASVKIFNMPSWGNWGNTGSGAGTEGPQGPEGPQGEKGDTGPAGADGAAGPAGATGAAGPQGVAGPTGPQGVKGDTGAAGSAGPAGATGPTGPQGVKGDTGAAGPTGPQGVEGPMGSQGIGIKYIATVATIAELPATATQGDLYIVSTPAPATSYVWDATAFANAGPVQGPQGVDGAVGPVGPTGAAGAVGPAGPTGPAGPNGEQGISGADGPAGSTGPQGVKGDTGPAGPTLVATATVLGGIKVGTGLAVTADGLLSASGGGGSAYVLPIATATTLGGIKVGTPAAGKYVSGVGADGALIYSTASATGSPLRLPPTEVASFNGVDSYLYQDTIGQTRIQLPGSKTGFRIEHATGDFLLQYKLFVQQAATFSSTVNIPGSGTASSLTFGATTYNLTVGTGGIAWRNNTTNIQIVSGASITNAVPMVTPPTGNGVVFGSGGAALNRGSTSAKIAATGMIELPATTPVGQEATSKAFTDSSYAPKAAADGRDLTTIIDSLLAEIAILKADVAALKAV